MFDFFFSVSDLSARNQLNDLKEIKETFIYFPAWFESLSVLLSVFAGENTEVSHQQLVKEECSSLLTECPPSVVPRVPLKTNGSRDFLQDFNDHMQGQLFSSPLFKLAQAFCWPVAARCWAPRSIGHLVNACFKSFLQQAGAFNLGSNIKPVIII